MKKLTIASAASAPSEAMIRKFSRATSMRNSARGRIDITGVRT
jgi:hypothetical protein